MRRQLYSFLTVITVLLVLPFILTAQSSTPLPPLAPNSVYPGDGFANVPSNFTLRWNSGLDAARTNSQWPVTYAIYYRYWPMGGTEPASYFLFASGLPCTTDATGICTMAVSGMSAGNYRYYIVANMDVSASTGIPGSILSTQSAPTLFSTGNIPASMIPAPLPPNPVFPSDGVTNVPASFTVRWTDGLDAARRNSLWPVTYSIYYKFWSNGGAEPANYALYASGLPCNPDSTGDCTLPASGGSIGTYRFYVVANMNVSASTGIPNSILSTQGPPAMFGLTAQTLPPLQSPPNRVLAWPPQPPPPAPPTEDIIAVDEPVDITPTSPPAPPPAPLWMVYRAFFLHLAHLDALADQDQANGNMDSANGWRTYEQQAIGLNDSEGQFLKQIAYSCNAQIKTLDTTLQTEIANFHAQYPNGKFLNMPPPPEISQTYQQKVAAVNSCIAQLSTGLGTSFQMLDNYIQTHFQPSQAVPVPGPRPSPTPVPISLTAVNPPPPDPPTDATVVANAVAEVDMFSFLTINPASHAGNVECSAHPDNTTLANYDFFMTDCHLMADGIDVGSTASCFSDPFLPFTDCQGSFIAVSGHTYNAAGLHNMIMLHVPPANSTESCFWADPLQYGITVTPPIIDEQGSVFAFRGSNACWGDGGGNTIGLAETLSKPATLILINPTQATVFPGGTQQFTANIPVAWSMFQGPGSIDATTGNYQAPATIDTPQKAIIQGCNKNSINNCATATINLSPVTLTLTAAPDKQELVAGENTPLTVTFNPSTFDPTGAVDWSVSPNVGSAGTDASKNSFYVAPAANDGIPPGFTHITITAKSHKNPAISATTTVTVVHIDDVLVTPASTALFSGGTTTVSAVTSPGTALAHTISWSASGGTINQPPIPPNAVSYTAPTITKEQTVKITANIGGKSGETSLVVVPPTVISSITPSAWNSGEAFQLTVTGTGFGPNPQIDFGDPTIGFSRTAVTDPDTAISGNVSVPTSYLGRVITIKVSNTSSVLTPPPAQKDVNINPVAIAVALSPASASVQVGQSATFASNVTCKTASGKACPDLTPPAVTCILKPPIGTVTSGNGCVYTATPPVSASQSVQITACSVLVPVPCTSPCIGQTCGTATVTVTPVNVTVAPKNVTLFGGQTKLFTASVTNNPNTAVSWSVVADPLAPAGTNPGTIDQNGNYTAPNPVGVQQAIKIKACSQADSSRCDLAPAALIPLVVTPSSAVVVASKTQAFAAAINGISTSVTWSLDPNVAAAGSITPQGLYTAPSSLSTVTRLTVIATSTVDGSKGTATVVLGALCYPRCRPARHPSSTAAVVGQSYSGSLLDPTVEIPQGFIYAGNLPPNLNFATDTGTITGVPVQPPAIYGFAATPFYADGDGGTEIYAFAVCQSTAAPPINVGSYLVNSPASIAYMPGANPAGMFSYSVTGTLPPGMSLDPSTGIVSGTPTAEGTYTYMIHAALQAGVPANTTACPTGTTSDATYQATVSCPSCRSAGLTPANLAFPGQMLGTASSAQSVTLTNNGTDTLSISSIVASGDFAQTNNCGSSLGAHASCTINVTFAPTAPGWRTGTLAVTDNAAGSPHNVSLSGAVLQGYHDIANCDGMAGWAWDSTQPNTPITVYFFDGTRYLGSATADKFRPDLAGAFGMGYHGFSWANDVSLFDGAPHSISVHTGPSASSPLLNNSPRSISCSTSLTFSWIQPSAMAWGPPNTLTAAGFATGGTGNVALSWRDVTLNGTWTSVPYQAPTDSNNGGWSNTIPSADNCHVFQASVSYSGKTASRDYDGVALGYCSFRVIWIQPQSLAGFGPAGSLVVAGSAQGGPPNSQVTLWVHDDTIGSAWAPLNFAPLPDATGIWYNAIENVDYSHQYSVYIIYNDRKSGGCSYFGNGAATTCPQ